MHWPLTSTDPHAFEASYDDLRMTLDTYWTERLRTVVEGRGSYLRFAERRRQLVGMAGALIAVERHIVTVTAVFVTEGVTGRGSAGSS